MRSLRTLLMGSLVTTAALLPPQSAHASSRISDERSVTKEACEALLADETQVRENVRVAMTAIGTKVLGQEAMVEKSVVAVLTGGHTLLIGPTGVAKTRFVKTLASAFSGDFKRIQFVPDLLPGDILGAEVFDPHLHTYRFRKGPIFNNIVMADEINRAATKTQSAFLEAMEERQVTIDGVTYELPNVFLVFGTQNPGDHEGTSALPEAQLDRFMMRLSVTMPDEDTERAILRLANLEARQVFGGSPSQISKVSLENVMAARYFIMRLHMPDEVENLILKLVGATRHVREVRPQLAGFIREGIGPRGSIALSNAARGLAWLRGKSEVTEQEIQDLYIDVLAHRLKMNVAAVRTQNVTAEQVLKELFEAVQQK